MSLPIEFNLDLESRPHAVSTVEEPACQTLAQFLETDLGFHRDYAERILTEGRRIVEEQSGPWTTSGNIFSLAIGAEETVLAPLSQKVDLEPVTLPTDGFLEAVEGWSVFVSEIEPPAE